jgi:Amt family ammonium transporter
MRKRRLLFTAISLTLIMTHFWVFGAEVDTLEKLRTDTDILWTVIAAILVFFMQAGFALVEAGFTRAKSAANIIMKNMMDFCVGSLAFWLVGASLMFGGHNSLGWFAGDIDFGLASWLGAANADPNKYSWLIFQTVFAATAATIVSGAMAERTKFSSYLIYSLIVTVVIYPIFGSWAWNGLWAIDSVGYGTGGWLESFKVGEASGFIDFAGSTVVHSIGGWLALAGAMVLGPRRGRYTKDGRVIPIPGHSLTLAGLGVFILWLGWFGFNPGSTVSVAGGSFATIAVTTNLAAAAGAIGALVMAWGLLKKPDVGMTLNGALAGLVAITAGCANVSPLGAAFIGFTAGIIVVLSVLFFDKIKIDDPVGAVSVHGVCGAWGTLLVGFLANPDFGGTAGSFDQFLIQLTGVAAAFGFAMVSGLALFYLIKVTIGLRVSEHDEVIGLDISEHGAEAYADFRISQR